jgi:hypothetical protein
LGKPTNSPTLRWVFQCFMAVHFVSFQNLTQVANLSPLRLHILVVIKREWYKKESN